MSSSSVLSASIVKYDLHFDPPKVRLHNKEEVGHIIQAAFVEKSMRSYHIRIDLENKLICNLHVIDTLVSFFCCIARL